MSEIKPRFWVAVLIGITFAGLLAASSIMFLLGYAWATQPMGWESMSAQDYVTMFAPILLTLLLAASSWVSWRMGKSGHSLGVAGLAALLMVLFVLLVVV
ncbi:MAG: hypothetical protein CMN71_03820 [Sphingomonadaceae bacterium]|nr:hypothetical protein [Sphingomonadaceae bacterium]